MKAKLIVFAMLSVLTLCACDKSNGTDLDNENNNTNENINDNTENNSNVEGLDLKAYVDSLNGNYSLSLNIIDEGKTDVSYGSYTTESKHVYKSGKLDGYRFYQEDFKYIDHYTVDLKTFQEEKYSSIPLNEESAGFLFALYTQDVLKNFTLFLSFDKELPVVTKNENGLYEYASCLKESNEDRSYIFLETEDSLVTRCISSELFGDVWGYEYKVYETQRFQTFDDIIRSKNIFLGSIDLFELSKHSIYNEEKKCYEVTAELDQNTQQMVYNGSNPVISGTFTKEADGTLKFNFHIVGEGVLEGKIYNIGKTTTTIPQTEVACNHPVERKSVSHQHICDEWYHVEECSKCRTLLGYKLIESSAGYCPECTGELLDVYYEPLCEHYALAFSYNCVSKYIRKVSFKYLGTDKTLYSGSTGNVKLFMKLNGEGEYIELKSLVKVNDNKITYAIITTDEYAYFAKEVEYINEEYDNVTETESCYYNISDFFRDPVHFGVDKYTGE